MIKEKILCGFDLGSHSMKASLMRLTKTGALELLDLQEAPTKGFRGGSVSDLSEFSNAIHAILSQMAKKTGHRFKDVHLGLSGQLIYPRYSRAIIPLADRTNKIITQSDIKRVNSQAKLLGIKMEEEILHDIPQYYIVDDANRAINPAGLYGYKLAVNLFLIIGNLNLINNIAKAVDEAGYSLLGVSFSSLAACDVALDKEKKTKGSLVIDIGSKTTNLLFFKDGFLHHLDVLQWGGSHLTENIARELHVSFDFAEEIKKSHASALPDDTKGNAEILIKKEGAYLPVKRKLIGEAVETECAQFMEKITNALKFSHMEDKLVAGIVMIGGGSLLSGLIERMESQVHLPVSIGQIKSARAGYLNAASFIGSVGLVQSNVNKTLNHQLLAVDVHRNWINLMANKVKDLYSEYF